jgi:hypothetical protein
MIQHRAVGGIQDKADGPARENGVPDDAGSCFVREERLDLD